MATEYSISWLYGELRIARYQRGRLVQAWEASTLVETQPQLVRALGEAAQYIDLSKRGSVAVVHEHDLHTHEFMDVPLMSRRDLEKYLLRRMQTDTEIKEPVAWCYHTARHRDGSNGVLLHQLPKRLVEATTDAISTYSMVPKHYVPLTEIVSHYLPTQREDLTELLIVAALFSERTEIIVTLADGEVLLVRELSHGLNDCDVERLTTDINRTIRYARQQAGKAVAETLIMGDVPEATLTQLDQGVEVPLSMLAESRDHLFWATQAASLPNKLSANFISMFARRSITSRSLKRSGLLATAALVAMAVAISTVVTGLVAHKADNIALASAQIEQTSGAVAVAQSQLATRQEQLQHLSRLQATNLNLPSLFLLHLSQMVPADITLTGVAIDKSSAGWDVQLEGSVASDIRRGAVSLYQLEEKLARPPWNLAVKKSWRVTWLKQFQQGAVTSDKTIGFDIEGTL